MGMVVKLKRDLGKNRGKSAVLGVLFLGVVVMSVRAVLELRPREIQAAVDSTKTVDPNDPTLGGSLANAQGHIRESQELWRHLRQENPNGTDVDAAFKFDGSLYPPPPVDMTRRVPLAPATAPEISEPVQPASIPLPVDEEALKAARIREQARGLVVKSTVIGSGVMESMTIVNQQLLKVGQAVQGFEVVAIREREVELKKEGVITVIRMPDGQNSQK